MNIFKNRGDITSFQIIILGFFAVIMVGCGLLMLPIATKAPGGASFMDALFTSTSAVCVTGLVVHDTATYWSEFGHVIILILIQIGGMGVITVAGSLAMIVGKKIGLFQRNIIQEAIAAHSMGGVVRLIIFIIKTAFVVEVIGAVIISPFFCRELGYFKGIFYALFHSISAFCNAGFDLMGYQEQYSSLTSFVGNPVVNIVIIFLIIFGGLGFLTWEDIYKNKWHFKKYKMQSKVILATSLILIFLPLLYFYFVEFQLPQWKYMTQNQRIWASVFHAVTPRTAGFNTVDMTEFSGTGQLLTMILMLIGGSPGSTAGGMKTTTIAVLFLSAISVFRRDGGTHCFDRRITDSIIRSAAAILMMYLILSLTGGMVISSIEHLPIMECLFETSSAIGTVGLSLGITSQLGLVSRLILIVLMYLGRVGGLTLIFAALSGKNAKSKYPKEKITVG